MIADLPGAPRPVLTPPRRQRRQSVMRRAFQVYPRLLREPAAVERCEHLLKLFDAERRIEEHDIERLRRASQIALRLLYDDLGAGCAQPLPSGGATGAEAGIATDERDVRR